MIKDYYKILEVEKHAQKDEIKKAFRRLVLKYHPDKNSEADSTLIKDVNEAWGVLGDDAKRADYDLRLNGPAGFTSNGNFNAPGNGPDWNPNGEGFSHNYDFNGKFNEPWFKNMQNRVHRTDHLNVILRQDVTLHDLMEGTKVKIAYSRNKNSDIGVNDKIDDTVEFELNLRENWQPINIRIMSGAPTYYMRFVAKSKGNEEIIAGVPYVGDVMIDLTVKMDENLWIENNGNISHRVDINIGDILFDEPILVTTCCNENFRFNKYEAQNLNDIKLIVKEKGIRLQNGQRSDYLFIVNVVRPNTKNLTEDELIKFKELLKRCEF